MKKRVGFSSYYLRIPIYSWFGDGSFAVWNDFAEMNSLFEIIGEKYRLRFYLSKGLIKVFKTL